MKSFTKRAIDNPYTVLCICYKFDASYVHRLFFVVDKDKDKIASSVRITYQK